MEGLEPFKSVKQDRDIREIRTPCKEAPDETGTLTTVLGQVT